MLDLLLFPFFALFHAVCSLFHSPRTAREKWLQWLTGVALVATLASIAALMIAFSLSGQGQLSILLSAFAAIVVSAQLAGWCAHLLDASIRTRQSGEAEAVRRDDCQAVKS